MDARLTDPPPAGRPTGFAKRWLFRLVVALALLAVAEVSSAFVYRAIAGRPFSWSRVDRERRRLAILAEGDAPPPSVLRSDIHPYLGMANMPDWPGPMLPGEDPPSDWGFTDKSNRPPVRRRGPGKVVVAILGGSVASAFAGAGTAELARELKQSPRYAGKEIEFVSLAVGGFKQPQQLMALNYAHAVGGEFDVVINLDGLNEVAWYRHDNGLSGVYHLYPIGWQHVVAWLPDPAHRREVGKIAYLWDRRVRWASLFEAPPLRWSVTASLVWKACDRVWAADVANTEVALRRHYRDDLPFRAHGPRNGFTNDDERAVFAQLVANWERCSLLLDRLCRAHGCRYYHFLQPNQYVPGSKPIGDEERRVAMLEKQEVRPSIERGYPLLRAAGRRLREQSGVRFHDLSLAFAGHPEPLYCDTCCHINRAGNEILGRAIARAILETDEPPRAPEAAPSFRPAGAR